MYSINKLVKLLSKVSIVIKKQRNGLNFRTFRKYHTLIRRTCLSKGQVIGDSKLSSVMRLSLFPYLELSRDLRNTLNLQ